MESHLLGQKDYISMMVVNIPGFKANTSFSSFNGKCSLPFNIHGSL